MDVVILCGGKGTRLSEETVIKPKPMVEIGGLPILLHIMNIYSFFGHNRFILALGYKSDYIKQYFYNRKITNGDMRIKLNPDENIEYLSNSNEKEWDITLIDTGLEATKSERINKIEKYVHTENFHLTYGDGVSNVDIEQLIKFHKNHGKVGTVTAVHPPSRFGRLSINEDTGIDFDEKSQMIDEFINGGFFVFNKNLFKLLKTLSNLGKDFEFGILKFLSNENELMAFKHSGFWQCMDNVRERDYLHKLIIKNEAPWIRRY